MASGDSKIKAGYIWMNGRFVPQAEATASVLSHALHYGTSAFEGIRAYATERGPAVFRLREHVERLFASAKAIFLEIPYTKEEIERAILETIKKNGWKSCYIRPLAWYGDNSLGVNPLPNNPAQVMIATWEWGAYLGEEAIRKGARLITSSWRRFPGDVMPGKAKVGGNYVNSALAKMEALKAGADEAILLDAQGFVAEGSGENLFFVQDGVIYAVETSVTLPGITRDAVIRIARDLGYRVEIAHRVTRDVLYAADEVFMTGTAAEVTPVSYIDWRPIGTGQAGEITMRLRQVYLEAATGKRPEYADWLTYVE